MVRHYVCKTPNIKTLDKQHTTGRAPYIEAHAWLERFGIAHSQRHLSMMKPALTNQLCHCRTDEARRLILGVSK